MKSSTDPRLKVRTPYHPTLLSYQPTDHMSRSESLHSSEPSFCNDFLLWCIYSQASRHIPEMRDRLHEFSVRSLFLVRCFQPCTDACNDYCRREPIYFWRWSSAGLVQLPQSKVSPVTLKTRSHSLDVCPRQASSSFRATTLLRACTPRHGSWLATRFA